jgi:hypothetical protein
LKSIAILTLIGLIGASIATIVMYPFPTLAMHDSELGVNTWLAGDNSTQRHAIDLNNGGGTVEEGRKSESTNAMANI